MSKDWSEYFKITKNKPTSPLLIKALAFVREKNSALDLGAGALRDTRYLLDQGFKKVTSVDSESLMLEIAKEIHQDNLVCVVSTFDKFDFPVGEYDLINAQFSIPFNPPGTSNEVFSRIKASLKKDGVFTGQFFGIRDTWNNENMKMTFQTKEQVERLLLDMEIIELIEDERDDKTALDQQKHWHIFHVIARKK